MRRPLGAHRCGIHRMQPTVLTPTNPACSCSFILRDKHTRSLQRSCREFSFLQPPPTGLTARKSLHRLAPGAQHPAWPRCLGPNSLFAKCVSEDANGGNKCCRACCVHPRMVDGGDDACSPAIRTGNVSHSPADSLPGLSPASAHPRPLHWREVLEEGTHMAGEERSLFSEPQVSGGLASCFQAPTGTPSCCVTSSSLSGSLKSNSLIHS